MSALREVEIRELGRDGDGVARLDDRRLFVPWTLPGERWRVRLCGGGRDGLRGEPEACLAAVERARPRCRHFTRCGACRLQHLPPALYRAFKRERVVRELRRRGLKEVPLKPLVEVPLASRRRIRLAYRRSQKRVVLGFRRLRGHDPIDVEECPVARPELVRRLPLLRRHLAGIAAAGEAGEAALCEVANGVELVLRLPLTPSLGDRERLAMLAEELDLARLAVAGPAGVEPVVVRREPVLVLGSFRVPVPPGAFLQPTWESERLLSDFVGLWLARGDRVADLYAGLGSLTLPHAGRLRRLMLVEGHAACIAALQRALGASPLVGAVRRDLERRPLRAQEGRWDVLVLNPPRRGAWAQVQELDPGWVPRVLYISCNPATFARDARALCARGYRLAQLTPLDQFPFSAEVELMAAFVDAGAERTGAAQG